jgi:peptide/nickel transport system permease protein
MGFALFFVSAPVFWLGLMGVTLIGLDLGALLGGAVITETVFNLQGVGQWAVASVFQSDLPVVLAVTVVVAIAVTMMNLIMDIVYAYLDPRVRYN